MSDNARILNETTATTPTILRHGDGLLYLVWPGGGGAGNATPNLQINTVRAATLPIDERDYLDKTVLGETTAEPIALASDGVWMYMAWKGTDPAGRINVMRGFPHGPNGNVVSPDQQWWEKHTLDDTCIGGPALTVYRGQVVLAWIGGGGLGAGQPNRQLNLAWSPDGLSWDPEHHVVLDETSDLGPSLTVVADLHGRGDHLSVAWTGGDQRLHTIGWTGGAPLDDSLTRDPWERETFADLSTQAPALWSLGSTGSRSIGWVSIGDNHVTLKGSVAWGASLAGTAPDVSGDTSSGGVCIAPDPDFGLVAAYPATNGHASIVLAPGGHYGPAWSHA